MPCGVMKFPFFVEIFGSVLSMAYHHIDVLEKSMIEQLQYLALFKKLGPALQKISLLYLEPKCDFLKLIFNTLIVSFTQD